MHALHAKIVTAATFSLALGTVAHTEAASGLTLGDLDDTFAALTQVAQVVTGDDRTPPVEIEEDVVVETEDDPDVTTTAANGDRRFVCMFDRGQYSVMYQPSGQGRAYPWATPRQLGGGWSPQRRCEEISNRLESYRPDGLLELRAGVENGYDTVCATTQDVPGCRIVFTVPPGQDPLNTRDRVFDNLIAADEGRQTVGINTFAGSGGGSFGDFGSLFGRPQRQPSAGITLTPFLSPEDGGTGTRLQSGLPQGAPPASVVTPAEPTPATQPQRGRLNPDNFF
ncbi:hypothetical protein KR51_00023410 [Rubidibacter lacunae KORDI 51-2]|uniref:Circadian oscillating protein COP23 n=1 Tax=Rubidibacter lacunae KORDI 51-2 TaxID=582515 RepID=U5DHJ1_9CHRO|nr:COP23 domain-containing protein [Rubidibacter lacunae]ERN41081.1 hypothetical protein KR51_00023410 [Rubidibacter lacunae KORDI 51-2]